jgi:hypothetical protein
VRAFEKVQKATRNLVAEAQSTAAMLATRPHELGPSRQLAFKH